MIVNASVRARLEARESGVARASLPVSESGISPCVVPTVRLRKALSFPASESITLLAAATGETQIRFVLVIVLVLAGSREGERGKRTIEKRTLVRAARSSQTRARVINLAESPEHGQGCPCSEDDEVR